MEAGSSNIRTKCLLENNVWKIDSEVIEDQSPEDKSFYRDIDLHKIFTQYCEEMLKGNSEKMYEMSSSSIRNNYSPEIFKEETTSTGTDKTPENEGFRIKAEYAYSDDNGNGICFMTMGNISVRNQGTCNQASSSSCHGCWKMVYGKPTLPELTIPTK